MYSKSTNFRMEDEYITLPQGDTLSFGFEVFDDEGSPVTLDGAEFAIRDKVTNGDLVLRITMNDGITNNGDGYYVVRLSPTQTKGIQLGEYFYDLRIFTDDDVFTIMRGVIDIVWSTEYN